MPQLVFAIIFGTVHEVCLLHTERIEMTIDDYMIQTTYNY